VREEIDHIREGKHGARSAKQAIAIGLSKARRAGVKLPPPKPGHASAQTRKQATRDLKRGRSANQASSSNRSRAASRKLKKEGHAAASHRALSAHAKSAARTRSAAARSDQAKRAARTRMKERSSQGDPE
jgi:hypothetical protein